MLYSYVSKDVRIRRYSSRPKGARQQKSFGNTGLDVTLDNFSSNVCAHIRGV
jgi:hypothetical protein